MLPTVPAGAGGAGPGSRLPCGPAGPAPAAHSPGAARRCCGRGGADLPAALARRAQGHGAASGQPGPWRHAGGGARQGVVPAPVPVLQCALAKGLVRRVLHGGAAHPPSTLFAYYVRCRCACWRARWTSTCTVRWQRRRRAAAEALWRRQPAARRLSCTSRGLLPPAACPPWTPTLHARWDGQGQHMLRHGDALYQCPQRSFMSLRSLLGCYAGGHVP